MAFALEIDSSLRLVSLTYFGTLSDDDLLESARQVREDPGFAPDFDLIMDAREVDKLSMRSGLVREIAHRNPYGPGSRRAIVAPDDTLFGVARMFELSRPEQGDVLRVFRSRDAAIEWLDQDLIT